MNGTVSTLIVLLVIAVAVFFAVKRMRANGACSCGHESQCKSGGCSSCPSEATSKEADELNKKRIM